MTDYPAVMVNANGDETAGDTLSFTDPDNQPAGSSGPLHAAATGSTPIMVDTPDGDPILSFDADETQINSFYEWDFGGANLFSVTALHATGTLFAGALGPMPFVTIQAGPPDPIDTYLFIPLVYDSTAVTGGLYAWDGTQYQKIGNLVS